MCPALMTYPALGSDFHTILFVIIWFQVYEDNKSIEGSYAMDAVLEPVVECVVREN